MFTALKKGREHTIISLINSAKIALITLWVLRLVGYDNPNQLLYSPQKDLWSHCCGQSVWKFVRCLEEWWTSKKMTVWARRKFSSGWKDSQGGKHLSVDNVFCRRLVSITWDELRQQTNQHIWDTKTISNDETATEEVLWKATVQECLKYQQKMVYCVKTLQMLWEVW